jgi:hypothetical protein
LSGGRVLENRHLRRGCWRRYRRYGRYNRCRWYGGYACPVAAPTSGNC